jgi:hypothetical protein
MLFGPPLRARRALIDAAPDPPYRSSRSDGRSRRVIRLRRLALGAVLLIPVACSVTTAAGTPSPDGVDAADAEVLEAGDAGASSPAEDGATPSPEGGPPDDLLGTLSGSCGLVKSELAAKAPSFERNALVFVAGETYGEASLSPDGQILYDTPNAGGSSAESEVMSFEVLHACEGAKLLKSETQIGYVDDDAGAASITDILVEIDGKKVGVSVTRAYHPAGVAYPDSDVKALLEKKLEGVLRSSARVAPEDRWVKQVLHVFAATKAQADAVERVLPTIDAALRADTIVLLTQTTGGGFVYCNPDPPLGSECP